MIDISCLPFTPEVKAGAYAYPAMKESLRKLHAWDKAYKPDALVSAMDQAGVETDTGTRGSGSWWRLLGRMTICTSVLTLITQAPGLVRPGDVLGWGRSVKGFVRHKLSLPRLADGRSAVRKLGLPVEAERLILGENRAASIAFRQAVSRLRTLGIP